MVRRYISGQTMFSLIETADFLSVLGITVCFDICFKEEQENLTQIKKLEICHGARISSSSNQCEISWCSK